MKLLDLVDVMIKRRTKCNLFTRNYWLGEKSNEIGMTDYKFSICVKIDQKAE